MMSTEATPKRKNEAVGDKSQASTPDKSQPSSEGAGHTAGDTVYTPDGRRAEYVTDTQGGFVVRLGYKYPVDEEFGEFEEYFEELATVKAVFASPPTKLFDAEIARQTQALEIIKAEISAKHEEINAAKKEADEFLKECEKFMGLGDLRTFVNGGITHFVVQSGGNIRVLDREAALKVQDNGWPAKFRLLALYGDTKGNLEWGINHWSDGSGSTDKAWPCLSLEEAKTLAQTLIEQGFEDARESKKTYLINGLIKSAIALGIPVPVDIADAVKATKIEDLNKKLASLDDSRERLLSDLTKAGGLKS